MALIPLHPAALDAPFAVPARVLVRILLRSPPQGMIRRFSRTGNASRRGKPGVRPTLLVPTAVSTARQRRDNSRAYGQKYCHPRKFGTNIGRPSSAAYEQTFTRGDDLHWADGSSLDLFGHLAFTVADMAVREPVPLLIVGTARPVEREERLARLIAPLQREDICQTLTLSGLNETGIHELVQGMGLARPPTARQLSADHHLPCRPPPSRAGHGRDRRPHEE